MALKSFGFYSEHEYTHLQREDKCNLSPARTWRWGSRKQTHHNPNPSKGMQVDKGPAGNAFQNPQPPGSLSFWKMSGFCIF